MVRLLKTVVGKLSAILSICAATLGTVRCSAASYVWTGGGGANGNWSSSANWGSVGTPASGDTVVFQGATGLNSTNNLVGLVLNQIRFISTGFNVNGNSFTVTNSIVATNFAGTAIINNTFALATADVAFLVGTNITLTLGGNISGSVGVIKTGAGTVLYQGPGNNTYSGTTRVNAGTLQLNVGGANAFGGPLLVGDGLGTGNPTVKALQGQEIPDGGAVLVNWNGALDLGAFSETIGSLTLSNNATVNINGTLTIPTPTTITNFGIGTISGSGSLALGSGLCTMNVFAGGVLSIYPSVQGTAAIAKIGPGDLHFYGANNYAGLTTVASGFLYAHNNLALGAVSSGTIVSNGASLVLVNVTIANEPLTLNGPGYSVNWGALDVETGVSSWAGPITNSANSTLDAWNPGSELHVNGTISGAGGLELFGSGAHYFEGATANSYAGNTAVDANATLLLNKPGVAWATIPGALGINGTVRLLANNQIYFAAPVTINDGGWLDMNGYTTYIGSLSGTGGSSINLNGGYLYVDWAYGGTSTFGGLITGAGTLDKQSSATLILTNNSPYTGLTRVTTGTVLVNGSQPQSPIYVDLNGTLGGSGTVSNITMYAGTIATGGNQLHIIGDIEALDAGTNTATISGAVQFSNGLRTITVDSYSYYPGLVIPATVADAGGGIRLVGTSLFGFCYADLQGSNTFSGPLTIDNLLVDADTPWSLGATSGGTFVTNNGTLYLYLTSITNETLTLSSSTELVGNGNCTWNGPVKLLGDATILNGNPPGYTLDIQGPISGTGNLTVTSSIGLGSTNRFSGTSANTYVGTTTAKTTTLLLAKTPGTAAIPGNLVINPNSTVRLANNYQIDSPFKSLVMSSNTLLDLAGYNEWVGDVTMQGSQITSGSGLFYLNGDLTNNYAPATTSLISGNMNLINRIHTFFVESLLNITASISSSGTTNGLIKNGSGDLALSASNSFTGPITINAGDITAGNIHAFSNPSTPITVNAGADLILNSPLSGVYDFPPKPLVLNGSGSTFETNGYPLGALWSNGTNIWEGNVTLASDTVVSATALLGHVSALNFAGAISGAGGLAKNGLGNLVFSGFTANTYSGATLVNEGTLQLAKFAADAIGSGAFIIGDGIGGADADVVQELGPNQLNSAVPITINSSGLLDLNNFSDTVGALTFYGGDLRSGTGTAFLAGNVTVNENTNNALIYGNINLPATRTFDVDYYALLDVHASVGGPGGLVLDGGGNMLLEVSNSYAGLTTITNGALFIYNSFSLGATNVGTVVNYGSALYYMNTLNVGLEPITISGPGEYSFPQGSLVGNGSWAGPITLLGDASVGCIGTNYSFNLSGPIIGTGNLTCVDQTVAYSFQHSGTIILSGSAPNTFSGDVYVQAGTLLLNKTAANGAVPRNLIVNGTVRLGGSDQIANTADMLINTNGVFDTTTNYEYLDTLHGVGAVVLGTNGYVGVGVNNGTSTFDGIVSGAGYAPGFSIGKYGTGTFTLNGNNTFTSGAYYVLGGKMLVNGSAPQVPVGMNSGTTFGGSGKVGTIAANGIIAPGNSPGVLTSSNVTFSATGVLALELDGHNAGIDFDQLNVRGTNTLANATLQLSVNFTNPVAVGQQFVILNNDLIDPITGIFSGLPEGSPLTVSGYKFSISYAGGTGNDVVLTLIDTPASEIAANVTAGNGNHIIEQNECNSLDLVITNKSGSTMSGITATLSTTSENVIITQPYSTYANLPGSSLATNITPFQISTLPSFVCGLDINLQLAVNSSAGSFVTPIVLHTGGVGPSPWRFDNNTNTVIPDVGSIDSTNPVAGFTGPLEKVVVSLWLTHTLDSDLGIFLVAPDGTTVPLVNSVGSGADFGTGSADASRTVFDDAAAAAITSGTAPFVGTFRPQVPLANLNYNSTPNGNWKLHVVDTFGGSLGTLRNWSLFLYPVGSTDGGGNCDFCNSAISDSITPASLVQTNRCSIDSVVSSCGLPKPWHGVGSLGTNFHYNAYSFTNNSGADACVTVNLRSTNNLTASTYLGGFDPNNIGNYFLGNAGITTAMIYGGNTTYSTEIPAGASFVVVVCEGITNSGAQNFTLQLSGLPCPAPTLAINPTVPTNSVTVHWPTWAGGYKLEAARALPGTASWATVTNEPVVTLGRLKVTNAVINTNLFYRLHKP